MIIESLTAIAILGIAILFLNPGHLAMPDTIQSMLIICLIISYLGFSAFIFRERPKDERESFHVLSAGRFSYLVGVGALISGIIIQALSHEIDPWLVIALCAMVFSKILWRIYSHFRK